MALTLIRREDLTALLRKRHGTIGAFQGVAGLTGQQVQDFMRGKSNAARAAVARELGVAPDQFIVSPRVTEERGR